jgi:hypothetical protein
MAAIHFRHSRESGIPAWIPARAALGRNGAGLPADPRPASVSRVLRHALRHNLISELKHPPSAPVKGRLFTRRQQRPVRASAPNAWKCAFRAGQPPPLLPGSAGEPSTRPGSSRRGSA